MTVARVKLWKRYRKPRAGDIVLQARTRSAYSDLHYDSAYNDPTDANCWKDLGADAALIFTEYYVYNDCATQNSEQCKGESQFRRRYHGGPFTRNCTVLTWSHGQQKETNVVNGLCLLIGVQDQLTSGDSEFKSLDE